MYSFETKVRVRYSETDKMGYCYYGNYAAYFEVGRVETLRSLGVSYKELEDRGILLPVSFMGVNYLQPAYYDEELKILTKIEEIGGAKIKFFYETYNNKNEKINFGETVLVFINASTRRPIRIPDDILEAVRRAELKNNENED